MKAQHLKDELLSLVDEDTNAFEQGDDAFALPKEFARRKSCAYGCGRAGDEIRSGGSVKGDGDSVEIL